MWRKIILTIFLVNPSLFSQSIDWTAISPGLNWPITALAVLEDGELFAGHDGAIFALDSTNVWSRRDYGIPTSTGSVNSICAVKDVLFASVGSKSYRSTDKGRSWAPLSSTISLRKMAMTNDTVMSLGTGSFYRSVDRGVTWARAIQGLTRAVSYNDFLRLSDGTLLLATEIGLFRSKDNASLWTKLGSFDGKPCRALAQYPNGDVVLAADTSRLFLTKDRGDTWSDLGVRADVSLSKIVYADSSLYFLQSNDVYVLANDSLVPTSSGVERYPPEDLVPGVGGRLYATLTTRGIYSWDPAEKIWSRLQTGFLNADIPLLASEPGKEYVGVAGKGIFFTDDGGKGWTPFLLASKNPKAMLLETPRAFVCDSMAVYRTTDTGMTWQSVSPVQGKGAFSIARSGDNLFVGVEGGGIYSTASNGDTWEARTATIGSRTVSSLVSLKAGFILAGTPDGIYKTTDAGMTWAKTSPSVAVSVLFRHPNGAVFACASDGMYRSMDEGSTWKKLDSISGPVRSVALLGLGWNLIASTSAGTFTSMDLGASWKKSSDDVFTSMLWNGNRIVATAPGRIQYGSVAYVNPFATKWLPLGSLNQWYACIGCEPEEYRREVQQDGWCYPAIRLNEDMQVSKGFWIGYIDPSSPDQSRKNVIFAGPRGSDRNTFIPYKFSLTSMIEPPKVTVYNADFPNRPVENENVDGTQKSDLTLDNNVFTSSGIEMRRRIRQFTQQYHDNYIITEYTYLNSSATKLAGVYFYHLYRWAVNADTRYVVGNATGWGVNTMIDARGDGLTPAATFFPGNKDNDIRAVYAWHGKYPTFTGGYDNVGGPIFVPYYTSGIDPYQKGDTVGRLAASQFVGTAVLHADRAPGDTTDDMAQPATMSYESSDNLCMGNFPTGLHSSEMYALLSKGRAAQRHADMIGPNGDPATGSAGGAGYSAAMGFGPYTLQPGDSVHIVLVEAAAGIDEETALRVGRKFKYGQITAAQKNDTVYTGRDSLFQTFRRALANYRSGYMIPQPPVPPKTFSVNVIDNRVKLEWTTYADNDPKLTGFEIYRSAGGYYEKAEKVASCSSDRRTWTDSTCRVGEKYFYYITSIGRSSDNTGIGMTPAGSLQSSRYYTQTYYPVSTLTAVEHDAELPDQFALQQNYPNPFNPSTSISFSLPSKVHVTVHVFDALGRLVSTVVSETLPAGRYTRHWNASGLPSGMYFYRMQAGSFTQTKRLVVLK